LIAFAVVALGLVAIMASVTTFVCPVSLPLGVRLIQILKLSKVTVLVQSPEPDGFLDVIGHVVNQVGLEFLISGHTAGPISPFGLAISSVVGNDCINTVMYRRKSTSSSKLVKLTSRHFLFSANQNYDLLR
jgi:hypothetical protein